MTVATPAASSSPTVVLVHGAFADSSSWNGVIDRLLDDGLRVVAVANPLRGPAADAAYVAAHLAAIDGPVVLVGHSYGGAVIANAARGAANVAGLVFVGAFAPDAGESAADLAGKFPGGSLGAALAPPLALPGGSEDLLIRPDAFPAQFAADVPAAEAARMAVTQRPIAAAALAEASGDPAWKKLPTWFVYGDGDRNIPAAALAFMADRARSRQTVAVPGASHVVMISHPDAVADLIRAAVAAVELAEAPVAAG